jgi:acyl-coenzyme A thioesterase PaaI-like protein
MRMEDMVKAPALATDELTRRLSAEFPEVWKADSGLAIEEVWWGGCRLRQAFRAQSLRPGATISGATIMALGDYAVYVALLASIGWEPLAVTTSLNINFLRKPGRVDLLADCDLIKVGRRLVVGEVTIREAVGEDGPVAHLTSTYSIPPQP